MLVEERIAHDLGAWNLNPTPILIRAVDEEESGDREDRGDHKSEDEIEDPARCGEDLGRYLLLDVL